MKRAASSVGYVLLGLLLGIGLTPRADDRPKLNFEPRPKVTLDAGYADCRHTQSPDGQWWQSDQPHDGSRYKAGCGTGGLSMAVNDNWTAGVHYVSLGRIETHALAINFPGDDRSKMAADIDPRRPECATPPLKEGCLAQWHTASFVRGVNFSLARRLFDLGPVRFDAKGGLYVHKLSTRAVVEPLGCRDNCAWRGGMDQSAARVAPMWGVVARWRYLYVSWERYERIGEHTPVTANTKGPVEVKTIGISIPL